MSETNFNDEVKRGERFRFGSNWKNFLNHLSEDRIFQAEQSLKKMLGIENLKGKTFLDVGSGSGLFSLAAKRLGAKVYSFDYDPLSVACTKELKRKFYVDDKDWIIEEGSILDEKYIATLGKFDVVYSWGVLHHTGNMWKALDNVCKLVDKNGCLFVALYNTQQFASHYWKGVKLAYNKISLLRPLLFFIHFLYPTIPSIFVKLMLRQKPPRGMTIYYDLIDWLGGYPFEVSTPREIFLYYREKGFELQNLNTVGGRLGCNEYIFKKQ